MRSSVTQGLIRGATTCAVVVALALWLSSGRSAQAQELDCVVRAEQWHQTQAGITLEGVFAHCADATVRGDRARFEGDDLIVEGQPAVLEGRREWLEATAIRLSPAGVSAVEGCLAAFDGESARCCAAALSGTPGDSWQLEDVTCAGPSGIALDAQSARWTPDGVDLAHTHTHRPWALPYPVAELDGSGRAAGLIAAAVGYHADREIGGRLGWYQPLGPSGDLRLYLAAESVGAASLSTGWRWRLRDGPTNHLGGRVGYDGAADGRQLRAALSADATVDSGPGLGVSLVGALWSDGAVGRDGGASTLVRQRRDRHLAGALWAGGSRDRLWLGVYQRQRSDPSQRSDDTPTVDHLGSLPAAGWLGTLPLGRWAELAAATRFDRSADSQLGDSSNRLRLVAGGQLRALSHPIVTLQPGLWVDLLTDFDDPEIGDEVPYRRFETRLLGTLELSSPWVGGHPGLWHLVSLEARAELELTAITEVEGTPPTLDGPDEASAPYRLMIGLDQSVLAGPWRLAVPVHWLGHVDDGLTLSRVVLGTRLSAPTTWRWALDQRAELDVESGQMVGWTAASTLGFGPSDGASADEAAGLPAGRSELSGAGYSWGASVTLQRSSTPLWSSLALATNPLLARRPATPNGPRRSVAQTWLNLDFGAFGMASALTWPLAVDDPPDIHAALWLGRVGDLRWLLTGAHLNDGSWTTLLSLTIGSSSRDGWWVVSPPGPI